MNKAEFKGLLEAAIETVVRDKEKRSGTKRPPVVQIEFCGLGYTGEIMDVDTAVKLLFLREDLFYRIITVAVKSTTLENITVFVGVSGHPPAPFDKTWNDPPGTGPFRPMVWDEFENWPPTE